MSINIMLVARNFQSRGALPLFDFTRGVVSSAPMLRYRRRAITLVLTAIIGCTAAGLWAAGMRGVDPAGEAPQAQEPQGADGSIEPVAPRFQASPLPAAVRAPGAAEVEAIAAAYPDRVESTDFRRGEWALRIDGTWYYWEDGRLLTADLRPRAEDFTPLRFYRYYRGPLRIREVPPEFEERLRSILAERESDPPVRHPGFQDALYDVASRAEADRTMVDVEFLGHDTRVHPTVVAALSRVEAEVRRAAEADAAVAEFVEGLGAVEGFHWRNIAGTRARSFHSYGIAVDLIPTYYGGDFGYWRWAAEAGVEDWWALGEEDRFMIPQPIVDAFERNGFVWGGKWLFFDPIHFEYRPEVFLLGEHK